MMNCSVPAMGRLLTPGDRDGNAMTRRYSRAKLVAHPAYPFRSAAAAETAAFMGEGCPSDWAHPLAPRPGWLRRPWDQRGRRHRGCALSLLPDIRLQDGRPVHQPVTDLLHHLTVSPGYGRSIGQFSRRPAPRWPGR